MTKGNSEPVHVIKIGGSLLEDSRRRHSTLKLIASQIARGEKVVLVHGGGKRIDALLAERGIPKRTCAGLRITDGPTLKVVVEVLDGVVSRMLYSELYALGVRAAAISGSTAGTITAEPHPPIDGIELGHVGRVTHANVALLKSMLGFDIVPVVSCIAAGPDATLLNVNADAAASAIARALPASQLVFLTDVPGFLDEAGELVPLLKAEEARERIDNGLVTGGMRPKLEAALEALKAGVRRVVIAGPATHGDALVAGTGGTHLVAT